MNWNVQTYRMNCTVKRQDIKPLPYRHKAKILFLLHSKYEKKKKKTNYALAEIKAMLLNQHERGKCFFSSLFCIAAVQALRRVLPLAFSQTNPLHSLPNP